MLGYRTGETPAIQVHVKKPKPFKWLRKLFRRMKFKHARFEDGKYTRGQKDIEKWQEDTPLAKADYPDHRWQVLTRQRSRRGRSRSRDPKISSHQIKADTKTVKGDSPAERNCSGRKGNGIFMNMDALKHVLDNDAATGNGTAQTTKAEVHHQSPQRSMRCKDKALRAARDAEESLRSRLSGYRALDVELFPAASIDHPEGLTSTSKTQGSSNCSGNCSYPLSTTAVVAMPTQHTPQQLWQPYNVETNLPAITQSTPDDFSQTRNDQSATNDHDQDNDLNHLRLFEKKKFNKKPKKRKSKKRRPRRKGKYVELETATSVESLDDVQEQCLSRKSSCKSDRVRRRGRESILSPLQGLATGIRNLADAPVFHPAKYRGYKRFFDE